MTTVTANQNGPDASMSRLVRWVMPYVIRRWPALTAVLSTLLLKTGLDVLTPWPMKILVDYVLQGKTMPPALAHVAALLPGSATKGNLLAWSIASTIILFLLSWTSDIATSFANISFGQRMVYDLAGDLFRHLQQLSFRFHNRTPAGDLIRRVTTDSGSISTITTNALLPVVSAVFNLVVMFSVMWQLDVTLSLIALSVVPCMMVVLKCYAEPMMQCSYMQQEVEGQQYVIVEQSLSAIPVVQAFSREEANNRRFRATTDATLRATLSTTSVQLQFVILMGVATAIWTAAILWLGVQRVLQGHLTVGSILVFLSYLASLYGPLVALMYAPSTIRNAAGSARRVLEVLETAPEVQDRPAAPPLAPLHGHLRFDHVTFGYEPNRPILHDISLDVPPGQTLALVGATGAGKSTLVSLVPRFCDPWSGRVTLDGHDLRDVQLRSLRDQVALVLQEPFLFPLTIADNIAYGRPTASRAEIEAAARAANAHAFILQLPQGYDTLLGDRGATLSGGERQRLSIARALLKDAPILILDEPTSALDAETEGLLLEALERLMVGRTTLIVAHRLSTIRNADQIVVLRDGAIVEAGTRDELLARNQTYARFYSLQFSVPEEVQ